VPHIADLVTRLAITSKTVVLDWSLLCNESVSHAGITLQKCDAARHGATVMTSNGGAFERPEQSGAVNFVLCFGT
jgi:hypothetical protein